MHRVLEQPAAPLYERALEKLLRLTPKRALTDRGHPSAKLVVKVLSDRRVVARAEDPAERVQIAEERAGRLHVLHEPPQLGERVLNRGRGEQQDRRDADCVAHTLCNERVLRFLFIVSPSVVAAVDGGKQLMSLIDHDEVEWLAAREDAGDRLGARELAADEEDACAVERIGMSATNAGLDAEEGEELSLPLADQRLRNDDEQAALPFRSKLR